MRTREAKRGPEARHDEDTRATHQWSPSSEAILPPLPRLRHHLAVVQHARVRRDSHGQATSRTYQARSIPQFSSACPSLRLGKDRVHLVSHMVNPSDSLLLALPRSGTEVRMDDAEENEDEEEELCTGGGSGSR